ncbi:MAG TPA: MXAN_6640 family putative metalloprotease [Nocardioidaceae bacterium]|nr:MXAN_6640 family putative metalloprotease [Nocardioidaceae bacterium]
MRIQIVLGTVLSALLLAMTPVNASAAPGTSEPANPSRSARAQEALAQAKGLFRDRSGAQDRRAGRRTTDGGDAEHASIVLRDLALSLDDLDAEDRRLARRILARPTDGKQDPGQNGYLPGTPTDYRCSEIAEICLHWVTDPKQVEPDYDAGIDGDAPDLTDSDGNGVPDWVAQNQKVFEQVWHRIMYQLGYRAPLSDDTANEHGPNEYTDIYLAELGQWGMYGYCTVDDESVAAQSPAYCVVDDDFEGFTAGPEQSLRVTAAHEFFHAVQFAYNVYGDYWLMEGTAAWVEDEVFDDINDNLQYLSRSALRFPAAPLDFVDPADFNWVYGSWIWWRFLTEYFSVDGERDPYVIRQVWQRLAADGPAEGSLEAVRNVLARRGTPFRNVFAEFGAMNRIAQRWYDEGRSYGRYVAAPAGRFTITKNRPGTGWKGTQLSHLSTQHAIVRPGKGLLNGPWQLRVQLDLPDWSRGSMASIVVHRTNGSIEHRPVRLSARGNAQVKVPFNKRRISHVALALTNASSRIADCGSGTIWTCGGRPVDDDLPFAFRARAFR